MLIKQQNTINKLQYVSKSETDLNLRISNRDKDVLKLKQFQQIDILHKEITVSTQTKSLLSLNNSKKQT